MTDRVISRYLWIVPIVLVGLMIHQGWVAYSVTRTMVDGISTRAEVVSYEMKAMAAQTHGIMTLRAQLPNGDSVQETLSMPAMLATQVRNTERLAVRVRPGHAQQIIVEEVMHTQRRMAMINVAIAAIGAAFVSLAIGAWRRYILRRDRTEQKHPVAPDDG